MIQSVMLFDDRYYILATSERADLRTHALKHDETFGVFDRFGDILRLGMNEQGIYHMGMRHLSKWELLVEGHRPLLLSSDMSEGNVFLSADLTNPDIFSGNAKFLRDSIHLHRAKIIWNNSLFENISLINFGLEPVVLRLAIFFEADFADLFEVRGMKRAERGSFPGPVFNERGIQLRYKGLDEIDRSTWLSFSLRPDEFDDGKAVFDMQLKPKHRETLRVTIECRQDGRAGTEKRIEWDEAFIRSTETIKAKADRSCTITSSNALFDAWCSTSLSDIHMMLTCTKYGGYPYAGIPWFNAAFGRDGIIAALECLWIEPTLAKDVLAFLAAYQARAVVPHQEAEPGKIIHEVRFGEMAALGEVPFGTYYGSIDSTPLFIVLAGHYYRRTGDIEFIKGIWPNIELALKWIASYGDLDGDGFIEYKRQEGRGLTNQGWKDSGDSIFHADGEMATGPIALCEVQGYVYAAKTEAAMLASLLGNEDLSLRLLSEAGALRENFEKVFWIEETGMYALALDGMKQPCKVRTSNAGQCLYSGISSREHARKITEALMSDAFFSGWGIRTLAASEVRYNPMSYHNGSVWPHDNALIAAGFARYGEREALLRVFESIFEAAKFFDRYRLPELFCGFHRRMERGPTIYPVACSPQAWASGTVFILLQACLGISVEMPCRLIFNHPVLPEFINELMINSLRTCDAEFNLLLRRHRNNVSVEIMRKKGDVELVVIK